jgi:hypothetical protein
MARPHRIGARRIPLGEKTCRRGPKLTQHQSAKEMPQKGSGPESFAIHPESGRVDELPAWRMPAGSHETRVPLLDWHMLVPDSMSRVALGGDAANF